MKLSTIELQWYKNEWKLLFLTKIQIQIRIEIEIKMM